MSSIRWRESSAKPARPVPRRRDREIPHVTFFFNGGREDPFPGEERVMIPSPKVATYDLQPEMSADGVTDAVVAAIESRRFRLHHRQLRERRHGRPHRRQSAATAAVETVDACLGEVIDALEKARGIAIVTADHGNAEEMIDRVTGGPMTAHTTNPVPVCARRRAGRRHASRGRHSLRGRANRARVARASPVPSDMTTPSLLINRG